MDSLQDILGNKKFVKPDEMELIKDYIQRKYKMSAKVKLERGALIVSVQSSALASTLQMERPKIIKDCKITDKKLVIRTG